MQDKIQINEQFPRPVRVNDVARPGQYINKNYTGEPKARRNGYLGAVIAGGLTIATLIAAGRELANHKYDGPWGPMHRAEGKYLWNEVGYHKLPGDKRDWIYIVKNDPQNKDALKDGYQQGDMIRVPEPDKK
ncbi:MAG TPA: hypothetical protein VJH04_03120 [archaeon]|nr:hypothetical protein [archaeon]